MGRTKRRRKGAFLIADVVFPKREGSSSSSFLAGHLLISLPFYLILPLAFASWIFALPRHGGDLPYISDLPLTSFPFLTHPHIFPPSVPPSPPQVYSMLVYEGPGAVKRITRELAALLEQDGYKHVTEAVGAAHRGQQQQQSPHILAIDLVENGKEEGGERKGWWGWRSRR